MIALLLYTAALSLYYSHYILDDENASTTHDQITDKSTGTTQRRRVAQQCAVVFKKLSAHVAIGHCPALSALRRFHDRTDTDYIAEWAE